MNAITRIFDWLARSADTAERRAREHYLAQAADHVDLEARQRDLERTISFGLRTW
jgi:Protein of unknown function (DUF3563)